MPLHPKNRHQGRYDFSALTESCPTLRLHLIDNPMGDQSIDFSNPEAVKCLNQALLIHFYGVKYWDIPQGYLCPSIPGRADYIHNVAELLAANPHNGLEKNHALRILDIGTGANLVYPLIGHAEYGWHFVGTELDPVALASAEQIVRGNPQLEGQIELRLQKSKDAIFKGVILPHEQFDLTICNPPFHSSREEAQAGSFRKWENLGRGNQPILNFGGQDFELWTPGGELQFIRRMIEESTEFSNQCGWFTSLVSKEHNIPLIEAALEQTKVTDLQIADQSQGQKKSRIVAWTFQ